VGSFELSLFDAEALGSQESACMPNMSLELSLCAAGSEAERFGEADAELPEFADSVFDCLEAKGSDISPKSLSESAPYAICGAKTIAPARSIMEPRPIDSIS
jgi:hypothetical protein